MSHTVKIQTKFTQLECLKKAFEHFGWKIIENAKARTYSSDPKRNEKYQFVAVNPSTVHNSYDIGINVAKDGEIETYLDFFGGSIAQSLGTDGQNLDKLKVEYAYRVIEQKYAYEGATVMRGEVNQDGSIDVEVTQT